MTIQVFTVDGPSGSGKGTLCQALASQLGWHLLDSGALYRIVGLAAERQRVNFDNGEALAKLANTLAVEFHPGLAGEPSQVLLQGEDISHQVRAESTGELASKVAVHPPVRDALLDLQRSFAKTPGLVADGRDMGTVVFPEAQYKIFLTASAEARAQRRVNQLASRQLQDSTNYQAILQDIQARDERDMNRTVAPLKPADDALVIDSTELTIDQVIKIALQLVTV